MAYNKNKSLYEDIMKDVAKIVKRKINEASSVPMGLDGKPYGWGTFMGLSIALKNCYEMRQKALKNGKYAKGLYIYTKNPDLMQAAASVLFSGSIKMYGLGFVGGFDELSLNRCKNSTRYIVISNIDDELRPSLSNDKQIRTLITNIVSNQSYDFSVALIGTVPFEELPIEFKQKFQEYKLIY